jgi:CheY-like chemotaxis protein
MSRRLLVLEDDQDIQEYLTILLRGEGFEITAVSNGEEALALLDEGRAFDLILLDVIMPVMDGEEFLRRLRQDRGSSTPVILTSVDESIAARLRGVGEVQGSFLKGGSGRNLVALIRAILVD